VKLSLLITNIPQREKIFSILRKQLLNQSNAILYTKIDFSDWQLERCSGNEVEVVIITDDKKMSIGKKRNLLVEFAKGDYVAHVDTDDAITGDYVSKLLEGIRSNADVINFQVLYHHNGKPDRKVLYDKDYISDANDKDFFYRRPNHLMCFRRELAVQVPFPNVSFGEDSIWATAIQPLIKTQHNIPEVLYHYLFDSEKTETQKR